MTILPIELAKAVSNGETGLFIFQNKEGEAIRVFLRNGEIIKIDGLYGEGESEIGRLFLWGEGIVFKRDLPREYEKFVPSRKYNINGFLKILIETIKKERKIQKIEKSMNEILFDGFINFLKNSYAFLNYAKDEWIGFSKLIERLAMSIKNSIILIGERYILFFENKVEFIFSKGGYVNFEKIEEENLFEPFDYEVFIFSPTEYDKLTRPFEKEPDYRGSPNDINLDEFEVGVFYDASDVFLYVKDLNEPKPKLNCMLWK